MPKSIKPRNNRKTRRQNMRGGADPVEPDPVGPDPVEPDYVDGDPMDYVEGGPLDYVENFNGVPPVDNNFQDVTGHPPRGSPPKSSESPPESLTYDDLNNSGDPNNLYNGGGSSRKRIRNKRRKSRKNKTLKGGCSPLGSAILPFGLLGFQKYVQSYASRRKSYEKRSKKMRGRRSRKQSNQ